MTLKILSLNIWDGGLIWDNLIPFLKETDADIWLLQEVYDGKAADLPKYLRTIEEFKVLFPDMEYRFAGELINVRSVEGPTEIGNAVFSKFPILSEKVTFYGIPFSTFKDAEKSGGYDKHPKNLQHLEIKVGGTVLNIFNTHGVWGEDGNDNPARLEMGQIIEQEIAGKNNVVLAGDFNLVPSTQVVQNIEKRLTNVFKDELVSTFNMSRKDKPGYATSVVDLMFVSADLKVGEHSCPQVDVSDHLPLIVEVEVEVEGE